MPEDMSKDTEPRRGIPLAAKIGSAIGAATLAGAIVYGATRPPETQVVVQSTPTPSAASATPERTPIPTATLTKSPEPTKTPEAKEIPCKFLPDKLCSQGEWFQVEIEGKNYIYVGFNLPQGERVPVFAAVDGRFVFGQEGGDPFVGSSVSVRTPTENYTLKGSIESNFGNTSGINVKAGDIIGYAQATEKKSLGYDIVFSVFRAGPVVAEDQLKELLPEVFKKPSKGPFRSQEFKPGTTVDFVGSR